MILRSQPAHTLIYVFKLFYLSWIYTWISIFASFHQLSSRDGTMSQVTGLVEPVGPLA